jgi:L-rhamnose mutarotase
MKVALHTKVRADRIEEYEQAHRAVPAMLAALATRPVNVAWQARMAELLETVHDYSAGGGDAVLPVVWAL